MGKLKTLPWDSSEYLDSPEAEAAYLQAAMEEGDPSAITDALGTIARARGMTEIAKESGLTRESLYRALHREGHPEFTTVVKVMNALGLRLAAVPQTHKAAAASAARPKQRTARAKKTAKR